MGTHINLVQKRFALVAQGIVEMAPGIPFLNKIANLSSSCTTLLKSMKVAICTTSPPSWFRCRSTQKPDKTNAVQIYKAPQPKEKMMDKRYDAKPQDANLRDKDWTKTNRLSQEYKQEKNPLFDDDEEIPIYVGQPFEPNYGCEALYRAESHNCATHTLGTVLHRP